MNGRPDYDVGDLVVCVEPGNIRVNGWLRSGGTSLSKGSVYRVECLLFDARLDRGVIAVVVGARSVSDHGGFAAARFRKADPLPDALTGLLASKPVRERIDA